MNETNRDRFPPNATPSSASNLASVAQWQLVPAARRTAMVCAELAERLIERRVPAVRQRHALRATLECSKSGRNSEEPERQKLPLSILCSFFCLDRALPLRRNASPLALWGRFKHSIVRLGKGRPAGWLDCYT
jgi:hypothetical protein